MYNKASDYYREIALLESKVLQYVLFAAILMNAVCGYGIYQVKKVFMALNVVLRSSGLRALWNNWKCYF